MNYPVHLRTGYPQVHNSNYIYDMPIASEISEMKKRMH